MTRATIRDHAVHLTAAEYDEVLRALRLALDDYEFLCDGCRWSADGSHRITDDHPHTGGHAVLAALVARLTETE